MTDKEEKKISYEERAEKPSLIKLAHDQNTLLRAMCLQALRRVEINSYL